MENKTTNLADRIVLRPVEMRSDEEFLIELYYTTRDDILQLEFAEEQKRAFSRMQYDAQKLHYEKQFPDSKHDIILLDGTPVGRFWTARYETEIVGVDLSILPEHRNLRIGTFLLDQIFNETAQTGRVFNFHVQKTNTAAMRLYERLGCTYTGEITTHFKMQWRPAANN